MILSDIKTLLSISLLFLYSIANAQNNLQEFLVSVEANNKYLTSASKQADAERLESKRGIYLQNPEFEYSYLKGGAQTSSELELVQGFDFPTAYIHRNSLSKIQQQQSTNRYNQKRLDILLNAVEKYGQAVQLNRKMIIYNKFDSLISVLQKGVERKLELGEINVLETNRGLSEAMKIHAEIELLRLQRKLLTLEITGINGGIKFPVTDTIYPSVLYEDLDENSLNEIVNNHPATSYWENRVLLAEKSIDLRRSESLPKFELGYRQEDSPSESFKGIKAGVSIPLFENKNSVKQAKAEKVFLIEEAESSSLLLETQLLSMAKEYQAVLETSQELRKTFMLMRTPELLMRAFSAGQIDYTEFFSDYSNYKETLLYLEDLSGKAAIIGSKLLLMGK